MNSETTIKQKKSILNRLLLIVTVIISILATINLLNLKYSIRYAVGYSMYPAINNNDLYIVEKVSSNDVQNLKRGDLIIFHKNEISMVKRIIGIKGDIVEVKWDNIYVNGSRIKNGYFIENVKDRKYIIEDEFFVLGDNTLDSYDSRMFGTVKYEEITHKYLINVSKKIRELKNKNRVIKICY